MRTSNSDESLDSVTRGRYKIPYFQRGYVWKKENWEPFWEAVLEVESEVKTKSFIGILIHKREGKEVHNEKDAKILIDGQQRITTMLLFLKALALRNKDLGERFTKDFIDRPNGIFLEHNWQDRKAFEKIITSESEEHFEKGKKGIWGAYNFFVDKIDEFKEDDTLKRFYEACLGNLTFVSIDIEDEDEQHIFETLNALGVKLAAAELIKNFLFKKDEKAYRENWFEVFEKGKEKYWYYNYAGNRSNIDLFLYSALLVLSKGNKKYLSPTYLFRNYKHFVESGTKDEKDLAIELKDYASYYEKSMRPKRDQYSELDKISPVLWQLNHIIFESNIRPVVPYVLHILIECDKNKAERDKVFQLLESYLMRRHICTMRSSSLGRVFSELINNEKTKGYYDTLREKLKLLADDERFPSDNELGDHFGKRRTNAGTKLILYLMELHHLKKAHMNTLPSISSCQVEHIMPHEWKEKDWPLGKYSKEERNENYIPQIGNLTIVNQNLNSMLSNSAWGEKKKKLEEYSGNINITKSYLGEEDWMEEQIETRTGDLLKIAKKIWPTIHSHA